MQKKTFVALAVLLAAVLTISAMPPAAFAAGDVPNAPKSVYASRAASDGITLAIAEPSTAFGAPKAARYAVRVVSPVTAAFFFDSDGRTTMAEMEELSPGTKYVFNVYSISSKGVESAEFVQVVARTAAIDNNKPKPPSVIFEPKDGGIALTMSHERLIDVRFEEYVIEVKDDLGKVERTDRSRRDTHTVSGLTNGVTYTISVSMRTTAAIGFDKSDPTMIRATPAVSEGENTYAVLSGGGAYTGGSAVFTVTGDPDSLNTIYIGAAELKADQYSARRDNYGYSVVTVKAAALAGLGDGTHNVRFVYGDGEAAATLAVGVSAGTFGTRVATANVNMRTGPGTGYSTVGVMPKGSRAELIRTEGNWAYVSYNGTQAYVSAAYLRAE